MRTTNILKLSALVLGSIVIGCGSNDSSTGPGGAVGGNSSTTTGGKSGTSTATGGANPTTGGASNAGGTSASAGGTTAATTTSANTSTTGGKTGAGGTSATTGGKTGVGGTSATTGGKTGVGGTSATTGGKTGVGGTSATTGGKTGVGGTTADNTAVGGGDTGGATGAGGTSAVATGGSTSQTGGDMISDFEDTPGKGTIVPNPPVAAMTKGYWYAFKEASCTQTPASVDGAAVDSATDGTNNAMHSTVSGCGATKYSGFGVSLNPQSTDGKIKGPVDLSAWDGVTFRIKGTSSTQIYVEFQTTDCVRSADGGTATSDATDAYNCHGYLIKSVPTSWTTMYVPFALTGVRWFPTSASGGTTTCTSSDFCEAPALDEKKIIDIQFALEGPFNEKPQPVDKYDVWVDDLALYKFSDTPKDAGIGTTTPTYTMSGSFPFPANQEFTGCTKPTGADGKLLLDAYAQWKTKFVSGNKVVSPEIDNGATVSEGIAYGMLLAVYFGDKKLFDDLLGYLKSNGISGANLLMNWKQPGGNGSASDADEDAAFALQMARKQWGSAYDADAAAILTQFLAKDVDSSGNLTAGSDFTSSGKGASTVWNPSYFAPAYYKYFATVDTANASKWNALVTNGYAYLNKISGTNGLVPAWCSGSCAARGSGGLNYTDETTYQYDSHRMPFRTGLDACWNGSSDAKNYINKVVGFFAGKAGAAKAAGGGLGTIGDIYNEGGTVTSNSANNSMSLLGCAGAGSLAYTGTNAATFRDRVWAFLLEGHYTKNYMYTNGDSATKPGYTYYNATVGLLTALAMSGNFYIMK